MRFLIALALLFPVAVSAQTVTVPVARTAGGTPILATPTICLKSDGTECGVGGASADQVQGNVASGATDAGNPVKVGGRYNSASPAFTNGQRGDLQIGAAGRLLVATGPTTGGVDSFSNGAIVYPAGNNDGVSNFGLFAAAGWVFNGTGWDRARGDTLGAYTVNTPTAAAANGVAPGATAAVASSVVAKASAGNIYRVSVTTGGTAGYFMGFNATSAPADGAVTPIVCRVVAANSTLSISNADMPSYWSTGITFVFSSTGCFTKTASATAYIEYSVK